jgi:hypothetical protein
MFVFSVKQKQIKLVLVIVFVVLSIIIITYLARNGRVEPAAAGGRSVSAATAEERIAFLKQYGCEVDENSAEVTEVIIPEEFDEVYSSYNDIQLAQGFDLTKYAGRRVKRWTYTVTNYPDYEGKLCIRANMLVLDNKVIGGDICSVELDGFMHGFEIKKDEKSTA